MATECLAPHETTLRAWLLRRVAETLRIPESEVDPHASIMALGIDSLALIGLAGELAEVTGQEIHAELIWQHDSIAELARHLPGVGRLPEAGVCAAEMRPEPVVRESVLRILRSGADLVPVASVGFPGIAQLIRDELPERVPVCCLGLDGPERPQSIVRPPGLMASEFAGELMRRYPVGPLILMGYSFGGTIAHELACQLAEASRKVRLLLLEPPRLTPHVPEPWIAKLQRHGRTLGTRRGKERWRHLAMTWRAFVKRMRWSFVKYRITNEVRTSRQVPDDFQWEVHHTQIAESLRGYRPRPFHGELAPVGRPEWLEQRLEVWKRLVDSDPLIVPLNVANDHQDVRRGESARAWLKVLRGWSGGDFPDGHLSVPSCRCDVQCGHDCPPGHCCC